MEINEKILVAGGETLIGSALVRRLKAAGYTRVLSERLDWTIPETVQSFFAEHRPGYVFVAAGPSGGIRANQNYGADFLHQNLMIAANVIHQAHVHEVTKLLYLASSCTYPKHCEQPMKEEMLLTGPLEPTNEPYAIAKISGITMCRAYAEQYGDLFIPVIPADVFGPGNHFDPENAHVIPGLMHRLQEAKQAGAAELEVWGTGNPRREFLFVEDLADACLHVMKSFSVPELINLGGGTEKSIREIAEMIREIVGFEGTLRFDTSKPDGIPRKLLDSSRVLRSGWKPRVELREALTRTYEAFRKGEVYERETL